MGNPSPYDLNAEASRRRKKKQESRHQNQKRIDRTDPDSPSPYDLSSHGGLAELAERVKKDPTF